MLDFKETLILTLMIGTISQSWTSTPETTTCRVWCQLPCTYPWQTVQYYCCDNIVKTGRCPPIRPICPGSVGAPGSSGSSHASPPLCINDSHCAGNDKCCYDQCLAHFTCKPPEL